MLLKHRGGPSRRTLDGNRKLVGIFSKANGHTNRRTLESSARLLTDHATSFIVIIIIKSWMVPLLHPCGVGDAQAGVPRRIGLPRHVDAAGGSKGIRLGGRVAA